MLWFEIHRDNNNGLLVKLYYNPSYYGNEDIEKLVEYFSNF